MISSPNIPQLAFIIMVTSVFTAKSKFFYSNKTNEEGKCCQDFFINYKLTQIIDKLIRVPTTTEYHANLLGLFCIS